MDNFKLKGHQVKTAHFVENAERGKKDSLETKLNGNSLIPKDISAGKRVTIELDFQMGNEDEWLFLTLNVVSVFEIVNDQIAMDSDLVRKECLPVALSNLRHTVSSVTEAYGLPPLKLPPFEEESPQE